MAENITQYKAGQALLVLLQQQELKPQVVQQITDVVAELLQEAGRVQESTKTTKGSQQQQQQQQQLQQPQNKQPQQEQAPSIRDLKSADAVLQGVSLIVPRGKFDCGFYSDCLQVTNKQTTADIPYSSIQHVLIIDAVPKQPSTTFLVLVMKSGQPVRQGKNALDLVVIQTKDQPEVTLPSPAACAHLGPQLVGPAAVVLSQLLGSSIEGISEDTFLTADSSVFSSAAGDLMIAANKGTQSGWLVPLSAGLCYLGKQGSFMPKGSISRVSFHRAGGGSSTFDITIKLAAAAAAGGAGKALELGQIDAAELAKLQGYCLDQRIKMDAGDVESEDDDEGAAAANPAAKAGGAAAAAAAAAAGVDAGGSDSDEDDEDFDPEAAGRKGAKRRRLDGAGTSSAAAAAGAGDSEDDDDDEELEDEGSEDMSSDPELVATDEMSDMEDDGLGDYE